jgi:hypothetical protein
MIYPDISHAHSILLNSFRSEVIVLSLSGNTQSESLDRFVLETRQNSNTMKNKNWKQSDAMLDSIEGWFILCNRNAKMDLGL